MKTAEEILNNELFQTQYGSETFHDMFTSHDSDWNEDDALRAIKQIQLDAHHSALSEAADILFTFELDKAENKFAAIENARREILALRDKKES